MAQFSSKDIGEQLFAIFDDSNVEVEELFRAGGEDDLDEILLSDSESDEDDIFLSTGVEPHDDSEDEEPPRNKDYVIFQKNLLTALIRL